MWIFNSCSCYQTRSSGQWCIKHIMLDTLHCCQIDVDLQNDNIWYTLSKWMNTFDTFWLHSMILVAPLRGVLCDIPLLVPSTRLRNALRCSLLPKISVGSLQLCLHSIILKPGTNNPFGGSVIWSHQYPWERQRMRSLIKSFFGSFVSHRAPYTIHSCRNAFGNSVRTQKEIEKVFFLKCDIVI